LNNNDFNKANIDQPLDFLDDLRGRKHIALFYEEPEYARMVEYHFIKNGLLKEEHCIYTTHENDIRFIEDGMSDFGIDVKAFQARDLLHICKITDPRDDPQGLAQGIENLRTKLVSQLRPPIRIVSSPFIRKIENDQEKVANMFVERTVHKSIKRYYGHLICKYHVDDIQSAMEGNWMQHHLRHHHGVIFVLKRGKGMAFFLP
jgi:MEDS: MEthanogen/methylotroph, DcmR Sensory domain